jgi:hypothetical protein
MNRAIVSVSQNAVIQAESEIRGCDRCTPSAKTPFWQVLYQLRIYHEERAIYILPVLASCPRCRAPIDEITRVDSKFELDEDPANHSVLSNEG